MFKKRIDVLKTTLNKLGIDAFLISNFYNIFYLSGFRTLVDNEREAWLLITKSGEYIFTDHRYSSVIHDIRYITPEKRLLKHLEEIVKNEGIKTLAFESDDLRFSEYDLFKKSVKDVNLIGVSGIVLKQRELKDQDEVQMIKRACEVADGCLGEIVQKIGVGKTEKELALMIEFNLKRNGHDLAFYPIVAVDENSAVPHYDTRAGNNKKIVKGSVVLIDFGARFGNYLSDMTRMIFVGNPKTEAVNQYQKLLSAQKKTIEYLKPGLGLKTADALCREMMNRGGLPEYSHSTGHGVGLEIHEYPKMSYISPDEAAAGQVVTVEPGFYMPGKWGMRIEDTVLIKETGVETLTKFKKDLLII